MKFEDQEDWAELHGYVRIHCRIHGRSWSDVYRCESCEDERELPIMCAGCEDVVVEAVGDYCTACQKEIELDERDAPMSGRHGRPLC